MPGIPMKVSLLALLVTIAAGEESAIAQRSTKGLPLTFNDAKYTAGPRGGIYRDYQGKRTTFYPSGKNFVKQMIVARGGLYTVFEATPGDWIYHSTDGTSPGKNIVNSQYRAEIFVQKGKGIGGSDAVVTSFTYPKDPSRNAGVYLSPDGNNLAGKGRTTNIYSGKYRLTHMVSARQGVYSVFYDGRNKTSMAYLSPSGLDIGTSNRSTSVYSGIQAITDIRIEPYNDLKGPDAVVTSFMANSQVSRYRSLDGNEIGGGTNTVKLDQASPADRRIRPKRYQLGDEHKGVMTDAVGNQGPEGACVAFAVTSALATNLVNFPPRTTNAQEFDAGSFPAAGINILNARWFYGQRGHSGSGWNVPAALEKARHVTIPFKHGDGKYGMRIRSYKTISKGKYYLDTGAESRRTLGGPYEGRNLARNLLYRRFPLIARFDVYSDFQNITGKGLPYSTPGAGAKKIGGHAVMLTGYSVEGNPKYWVAQNSWGQQYGRNGNFLIHEGSCGIDDNVYWIDRADICDMSGTPAKDPAGVLREVLHAASPGGRTVKLFCEAGFVARFKIDYDVPSANGSGLKHRQWTSKNLSAGKRQKCILPVNARNVKVTGYMLQLGERLITTLDVDFKKEYKIYGTFIGPKMVAQ